MGMTQAQLEYVHGLLRGGQQRFNEKIVQRLLEHISRQEAELLELRKTKPDPNAIPGWVRKLLLRWPRYAKEANADTVYVICRELEQAARGKV